MLRSPSREWESDILEKSEILESRSAESESAILPPTPQSWLKLLELPPILEVYTDSEL